MWHAVPFVSKPASDDDDVQDRKPDQGGQGNEEAGEEQADGEQGWAEPGCHVRGQTPGDEFGHPAERVAEVGGNRYQNQSCNHPKGLDGFFAGCKLAAGGDG